MVRTQIQLTEEQAKALQRRMSQEGVSMAQIVRRSIDAYLEQSVSLSREARRQRALAASGRARSGRRDIARRHDRYLGVAFKP